MTRMKKGDIRNGEPIQLCGRCSCGRSMTDHEYQYFGGTYGYITCADCGRRWERDLSGWMWRAGSGPAGDEEVEVTPPGPVESGRKDEA